MTVIQPDKLRPWSAEYPFLSFEFNASHLPAETWALLGECSSKIEHVMGTPLRRDVADTLNQIFLARGVHGTTAIEGNTLSEAQVGQRIAGKLPLAESQAYLGKEVDNVVEAYQYIVKQLEAGVPFHLTPDDLRRLNRMVINGLDLEDGVVAGEYRSGRVTVSDYLSPSREHLEEMLACGCTWLSDESWKRHFVGTFVIPILRAILSHLYIAWMHPFGDGNGRTARLIEFDLLTRAGVPIPCAHLLSDYYNRTRPKYYRALSLARQHPKYFVCYAIEGLRDMLKEQIEVIRTQQMEVTWENYVYSVFRKDEESVTAKRRREIALVLGATGKTVSRDKIPSLSPKLSRMYSSRTTRTIRRDVWELQYAGLVQSTPEGVKANLEGVRAFLPLKGAAILLEVANKT